MNSALLESLNLLTVDELAELDELLTYDADYAAHLSILDKQDRLVPYQPNRAQLHFRAQRTARDLILKARQLGFSTEIQQSAFLTAITSTSRQATLAHDQDTTDKLRRMADRFYTSLPESLRPPRGLDNATTTTYPATGSEVTIRTAGSLQGGRGGTYRFVHGSEVAFWKDASALMSGLLQGVPGEGVIVLESTPNGAQGWFYEQCMRALDGASDWTLHFYPWWWDDGYVLPLHPDQAAALPASYVDDELALVDRHGLTPQQIAWRRMKVRELGMTFAQEYPEDVRACFLLSGQSYFGSLPDRVFMASADAEPQAGHVYVGGLDFGQTTDYTVCCILDMTTMQQVALLRVNRLPWYDLRQQVGVLCRTWAVDTLYAESNSIGAVNIEAMQADGLPMQAFTTTAQTKALLVSGLRVALAEGGLTLLSDATQRRELNAFQARQTSTGHWQFEAAPGEHDDTVIALALAVHAAMNRPAGFIRLKRGGGRRD